MLHRLCEPPSIPLSFSLATILPRRSTYCFRCDRMSRSSSRLVLIVTARTTGVSNPVRYPGFRASASVETQCAAFATGVPSNINTFHRSTGSSAHPYLTQVDQFRAQFLGWAESFHTLLNQPPTHPLSPVIPNNVCTVRITAAAGTYLARASSEALST